MIHRKVQQVMNTSFARADREISSTTPTLCVTFDDVPASACRLGAQIVEQSGGRATFYASGGLDAAEQGDGDFHTVEDLQRLHAAGHEIGSHGFAHMRYPEQTEATQRRDIALNQSYFEQAGIPKPVHFAYPFGAVNIRAKRVCGEHFQTCRGIQEGMMQYKADTAWLHSYPLHASKWSAPKVTQILNTLHDDGGWVIFYAHGLSDTPSPFDTTADILTHTLREANALGLNSVTMSAALANLAQK